MAASPRIFEYIDLGSDFELIKLSWMSPKKKESLASYAGRMCERVKHDNPVLIGVSFGGILVQEMAKLIPCRCVIIVSSVKSNKEFSLSIKLARRTGAHKLLPTQWIEDLESLVLFVFGPSVQSKIEAYQMYLSERDPYYLDWSIDQIVHWNQEKPEDKLIHIHGDKDKVFPMDNLNTKGRFYRLKNASHAMILTHHKWFNKELPSIILNNQPIN